MTGRQVLGALALILVATVVLPPVAAWGVHRYRVTNAQEEAARLVGLLQRDAERPPAVKDGVTAFCGPGRVPGPAVPAAQDWATSHCASLASLLKTAALTVDPWGNSYVAAFVPAGPAVISAGANGALETSLFSPGLAAGDDVFVVSGRPGAGSSQSSEAR